jgi:ribosomal protein S12 methylthiotransferase accessory factor
MANRLRFKRCFRGAVLPTEGVFLLSEAKQLQLRGRVFLELAPLLDGRFTEKQLVRQLENRLDPAQVLYALGQLREWGLVVDAPSSPPEQASFWEAAGGSFEAASEAFAHEAVCPVALGGLDVEPLRQALASAGLRVSQRGGLRMVMTDEALRPELAALNQRALEAGTPWMLVKPVGLRLEVGPLFVPGRSGCWECLAHRLRGHRELERFLSERGSTPAGSPAVPSLGSTVRLALAHAATWLARWLALGRDSALEGRVVTLDALTLDKQEHLLTRRPQCPACGDATLVATRQREPVELRACPKSFTADGGHRAHSPRETLERLERHVSPLTGIVGSMRSNAPREGTRGLVASYVTDRCSLHLSDESTSLEESLRSRAGGKGRTDEQARASALCEAIERYSGLYQGDEARVSNSLRRLGGAGIHPNACLLFSEAQLRRRPAEGELAPRQEWIPEPFDERARVEWSPVWSLTHRERRYVPTALCYFGYARAHGARYARADSNGCAAGNTLEEAILQGFLELVERDSVALWWFSRARRPEVDLGSFADPYFLELRAYYASLGRDLRVLDLTGDLDIPAVAAISRPLEGPGEGLLMGFGAHLDAHLAVQRALTEVNQSLPSVLPGARAQAEASAARRQGAWSQAQRLQEQTQLLPDASQPARGASAFSRHGGADIADDVRTCVRLAEARGLETLVLDQTRPDTGLHVVRVLVPGLRHFWARFAPGRLYDVPVRLGWLPAPLAESELNPYPVYS